MDTTSRSTIHRFWPAFLVLAYLAFSVPWIVGSDWAVRTFASDRLHQLHTLKGIAFVFGTAALLYGLAAFHERRLGRARRRHREAESRLRSLLDNVPEVILLLDRAGAVRYASPGLGDLFGLSRDDLLERSLLDRLHPDDVDRVRSALGPELPPPNGVDDSLEFRLRGTDGQWRICQGTVANLLEDDDVAGIVFNFRDVTAREFARTRLQQTEKLETVGSLASGIAHDFNNLLAAIRGYNELALEKLDADDPRRGDLEEVQKASKKATVLIRRLLAFSRRRDVEPVVLDPNAAIDEILPMLERLLPSSIDVEYHLDPGARPVRLDPGHLEQIVLNLATNARDAMPRGGTLRIETRGEIVPHPRIAGDFTVDAGRYTCIEVTDTGTGMGPETVARIFEPFFTTKPEGEGTGLGLATVFGIVKEYEGYVLVDSEIGRGTRFRIFLPADRATARLSTPMATKSARASIGG